MPLDLFTLKPLTEELNELITGGRVDKITQPEADEIRLFLRAHGKNRCLVISANPQAPRVHLTVSKRANPLNAPSFLMLLRKHLTGAAIVGAEIYNMDRVIKFSFVSRTEMLDTAEFHIYAELMNRYSNIVLTDGDDIILDAVKHIPLDASRDKCVLRGVRYKLMPQDKTCFLSDETDAVIDAFGEMPVYKYLQQRISGFAAATVNEVLFRAGIQGDAEKLKGEEPARLKEVLNSFKDVRVAEIFAPCTVASPDDFMPVRYLSVASDEADLKFFSSLNEAADAYYTELDAGVRVKSKARVLNQAATRAVAKLEKVIAQNAEKLEECRHAENEKIKGELITANIYKLKRGMTEATVLDYYTGVDVKIPLDIKLSPSDNAAAYYNKYRKLKRAEEILTKQNEEKVKQLDYVRSIREMLKLAELDDDMSELESELAAAGALKTQQNQRQKRKVKEKPSLPKKYEVGGYTVMAGRNNIQNDELTFKTASSEDIWLHVKNAHGAHVIIFTDKTHGKLFSADGNGETDAKGLKRGTEGKAKETAVKALKHDAEDKTAKALKRGAAVPDEVLLFAARLAAAGAEGGAEVDYTERKNVKRLKGGYPGMVTYTDYKTVKVN